METFTFFVFSQKYNNFGTQCSAPSLLKRNPFISMSIDFQSFWLLPCTIFTTGGASEYLSVSKSENEWFIPQVLISFSSPYNNTEFGTEAKRKCHSILNFAKNTSLNSAWAVFTGCLKLGEGFWFFSIIIIMVKFWINRKISDISNFSSPNRLGAYGGYLFRTFLSCFFFLLSNRLNIKKENTAIQKTFRTKSSILANLSFLGRGNSLTGSYYKPYL